MKIAHHIHNLRQRLSETGSKLLTWLFVVIWMPELPAQSIAGRITDDEGKPLPYASVYVSHSNAGTSSNADGYYELKLAPGNYEVIFQFIGYSTQVKQVSVNQNTLKVNVVMPVEVVQLQTVTVVQGAEDPAYAIMRKAISKAKYHLLQTDSYSARVYVKGSGQVTKIPWAFRRMAKEEGITTDRVYTSESVSEIFFERPATFKQRVISYRSNGPNDESSSPNAYINSSFYMPMVVGSVSPISPKAFSFYRFRYLGSFMDRGTEVNKIQVTPRSKGENVFEGVIYIREVEYNIHSLELKTKIENFNLEINQVFAPVTNDIWLPVTQKYFFSGGFMGAEFQYSYYASISRYQVKVNPDLQKSVLVFDEKTEALPPAKSPPASKKEKKKLPEDGEVSRKDLQKMMDEYEREEQKKRDSADVIFDYSFKIDSTAAIEDSAYWDTIRSVPLTEGEMTGYRKADSTYEVKRAEAEKDSLNAAGRNRFSAGDLIAGRYYKLGENARFDFPGLLPRLRYNTVEGFNFDLSGKLSFNKDTLYGWSLAPSFRYGFSGDDFYTKAVLAYRWGERGNRQRAWLDGGRYLSEFNPEAIHPLVNSLYSLFLRRNYMRLYEQQYAGLNYAKTFNFRYQLFAHALYSQRTELSNTSDYSFFYADSRTYTSNLPVNIETPVGGFTGNRAFITTLKIEAQPWMKFGKRNDRLVPLRRSTPELSLMYKAGWPNVVKSNSDFQQLELGFKNAFSTGLRLTIDLQAEAGIFLRSKHLDFVDYRHFNGGLTELAPIRLTGSYRMLDYYNYSTSTEYFSAFTYFRFRQLLFTQLPVVRLAGISESLVLNYLKTGQSPHYLELGYSVDHIFRFLRVELLYNFSNWQPQQFGWRIGFSSKLDF